MLTNELIAKAKRVLTDHPDYIRVVVTHNAVAPKYKKFNVDFAALEGCDHIDEDGFEGLSQYDIENDKMVVVLQRKD